jgi:hypothetical protein
LKFCSFYFRLLRKLPLEELVFVVETMILIVQCQSSSSQLEWVTSLLSQSLELVRSLPAHDLQAFRGAEPALVHALLSRLMHAGQSKLKIDALQLYIKYTRKLLVG